MTPPLIFRALLGLLMTLAVPASLAAFVLAGMKLRNEGGMNYLASGGFFKGCLRSASAHTPRSELVAGIGGRARSWSTGPRRSLYALHQRHQPGRQRFRR